MIPLIQEGLEEAKNKKAKKKSDKSLNETNEMES